jgi:hypothetical protein
LLLRVVGLEALVLGVVVEPVGSELELVWLLLLEPHTLLLLEVVALRFSQCLELKETTVQTLFLAL